MAEQIINITRMEHIITLFGNFDANIDILRNDLNVQIVVRDGEIKITGDDEDIIIATKTIHALIDLIEKGEVISEQNVRYLMSLVKEGAEESIESMASNDVITITSKGKPIKAKTVGQQKYIDLMREKTITLGIGPAGTGKTFLAVAMAVKAFRTHEVSRIVLTRPAVEAGEKLGFLPGDLLNKIDPYLRPLYDALFEMLGAENFAKHVERGSIEVAPLAYMRGRTLEDSFIILDEAQNTTTEQMKMFLTRLGFGSKAVITGDITQIDLPSGHSGLIQATKVLESVEDIGIMYLTEKDVVRHKLVQEIVKAYENYNTNKRSGKDEE